MSDKQVAGGSHRTEASYELLKKPDRKQGQPFYRCFWCSKFLCDRPLELCADCRREKERLIANLPESIK